MSVHADIARDVLTDSDNRGTSTAADDSSTLSGDASGSTTTVAPPVYPATSAGVFIRLWLDDEAAVANNVQIQPAFIQFHTANVNNCGNLFVNN